MAVEEAVRPMTEIAAADYSDGSAQNRFVTLGTGGFTVSSANARPIGVCTDKPASGKAGRIVSAGSVPVVVGSGGVLKGSRVEVGALGTAVIMSSGPQVGIARAAHAAGELATIELQRSA
jgi:hypothetical protein